MVSCLRLVDVVLSPTATSPRRAPHRLARGVLGLLIRKVIFMQYMFDQKDLQRKADFDTYVKH